MELRKHARILAGIYAVLSVYVLVAIVGGSFRYAVGSPIWLVAYGLSILVFGGSAYVLAAGRSRSMALTLPSAVAVAPLFPFGTLLAAYHLMLLGRQEAARQGRRSPLSRALGALTRLDSFLLVFAAVLLPYAALARNTIGGLNFIAAILSLVIAVIGVAAHAIRRKANWTRTVFVYACIAVSGLLILWLREMSAGYGP